LPLAVMTSEAGPAGAAGAGAGAARVSPPAVATSALTIRPPGPLPDNEPRSSPRSRAIRLASGEALTRPPSAAGRGWPVGDDPDAPPGSAMADAAAAGERERSTARSALLDLSPSATAAGASSAPDRSPTRAMTAPTGRLSPSAASV